MTFSLRIRYGTTDDAAVCQHITRPFRKELPFVMLPQLRESATKRELLVAEINDEIAGFVRYHVRRDGWHTVYDLAVAARFQGSGIGRNLLYAVPAPTRLKCTVDNLQGNRFWLRSGMSHVDTVQGRQRRLHVWERRVLFELVAGGQKRFPQIARDMGAAYGTRHDYKPYAYPFAVDIRYSAYDWQDYMHKIHRWRPVQALVADYQRPTDKLLMLSQVADLRAAGVLRILVCVKFPGAIRDVPPDCIVAISMPTDDDGDYAGYPLDMEDMHLLKGRKVHLLGGSPQTQLDWIRWVAFYGGTVISCDGSSHETAARRGTLFLNRRWYNPSNGTLWDKWMFSGDGRNYHTMALSGRLIVREMNRDQIAVERPPQQLPLFAPLAA